MKKALKLVRVVLAIVIFCLSVVGCNQSNDPKDLLVGKWATVGASGVWMEFKSDETFGIGYVYNGKESFYSIGTYKINDSILTLQSNGENSNVTIFNNSSTIETPYSLKDGKLTITIDGKTETYEKYIVTNDESRNTVDNIVDKANESVYKANAASIDRACKNYYAEVIVGTVNSSSTNGVTVDRLPERNAKASEKKSAALECTVYGALENAGLTSIAGELSNYCATEYGTVEYKPTATGTIIVSEITRNTTMSELFGVKDDSIAEGSDLKYVQELNPFDGLEIMYLGTSPFLTASINDINCSEEVKNNVEFSIEKDFPLRNGEQVKVTVTLKNEAYSLSQSEKNYTISNQPEFLTAFDDIDLSEIEKELEDKLATVTAASKNDVNFAGILVRGDGIESIEANTMIAKYLLVCKRQYEEQNKTYNRYLRIYDYPINRRYGDKIHIYVAVYVDDIAKDNNGKLAWNINLGYEASEAYDKLFNRIITEWRENYNIIEIK